MNTKLLSFFNYNGFLYEVFINRNNKISYKKIGKKQTNGAVENDNIIIKKLLDKIALMKYTFFDKIEYNNKSLNVYLNLFNGNYYFSQYINNTEIACKYTEFKDLYDSYNNKIIYNFGFGDNVTGFGANPSSNPGFGDNVTGFGANPSSNLGFGANVTGFGANPSSNPGFGAKQPEEKYLPPKKKNHNFLRVVKFSVLGILIVAVVSTLAARSIRIRDLDNKDIYNETAKTSYTEMFEEDDQKVIKQIEASLEGEEPWVIEQVIEKYKESQGISQEQTEQSPAIETQKASENTQKLINSINQNANLSDKDKSFIIENFSLFFENNLKYFENIDSVCETLKTLQIKYDIKELSDFNPNDPGGIYNRSTNEITIYMDIPTVKSHEIMHSIADLGLGFTTDQLSEGYTELYNPNRTSGFAYTGAQLMVLILEQIYGKDLMRSSFFNKNLYNNIFDEFDLSLSDYNEHWRLINEVNCFFQHYRNEFDYNPEALSKLSSLFERLRTEYETITGEKWEDNEVLKICYDRFFGERTSDKHGDFDITDIFIDSDGSYKITKSKNVNCQLFSDMNQDGEILTEFYHTIVSNDFEIGEN